MNIKNDKFVVWYNSFKIIETMNKKGSIDELLDEATCTMGGEDYKKRILTNRIIS